MSLDPQLLEILACPDTHHTPLDYDAAAQTLTCTAVPPGVRGARRHPGAAAGRGAPGRGRRLMAGPVDGASRAQRPAVPPTRSCSTTPTRWRASDPGGMLRATASAGAQVRESAALAAEANLTALADEGRPRAVVIAGVGTAARTGDILATVAGSALARYRCSSHRSAGVPGWVGAADVVIAVSRLGPLAGGARRGRRGGPARRPAGRGRRARLGAAVAGRAGPGAVHPGAAAGAGAGEPVGR